MKLKLLTTSILAGVLFASQNTYAAKYLVKEVTPLDQYRQHFAMNISDNNQLVGAVRDSFTPTFYLEDYLYTLTYRGFTCDVSEAEVNSGDFDAYSSDCIRTALTSTNEALRLDPRFQKVGDNKATISNAGVAELINLVDVFDADLGALTNSNIEQLRALNDQGVGVGIASAPFETVSFLQTGESATTSDEIKYWQQAYTSRAAVYVNGEVKLLEPVFDLYGGVTEASDISNSGYVSGSTSTSMTDTVRESIETDCKGELSPVEVCVWSKSNSGSLYYSRPIVWKLDANGNEESSQLYDLAFTPTEDQTGNYIATALSVNNSGTATGYGHLFDGDNLFFQPLYFENGETKTFLDVNEYQRGFGIDINDSGVITGYIQKDGISNTQFFLYDTKTQKLETPDSFYTKSDSTGNGINAAGKVVGVGEYEITTDSARRKHGFLYDSVTKEFFDLNALTECASDYEVIDALAINNNDYIAATALKLVDKRDVLGEVLIDDNGDPIKEEIAVAVILEPTNGEIEDCTAIENPPNERKGLTNSALFTVGLLLVGLFRRRIKK